ncbi:hypothetical protein CC78DRAFT_575657 [Lojkania enalia]|uniref:Uncharacterized protein n=1 Tax=Lojkania enalia TaxID=147567 RepID=A0A9P4N982_9PLEO|nr:hypothetical protein CC78DRAFT_575657 [Didymosphaeria enalia]
MPSSNRINQKIATHYFMKSSTKVVAASKWNAKTSWNLQQFPLAAIPIDYINNWKLLPETIHLIDGALQSQSKNKKPKSMIESGGIPGFLQALEETLPSLERELDFDFTSLTRACNSLFQRVNNEISDLDPEERAASNDQWNLRMHRGYGITTRILCEPDKVTTIKSLRVMDRIALIASSILNEYIGAEATGVP